MLHINYETAQLQIQCRRKHVLIDSTYYVYVLPEWLILSNSPKSQNPKYKITLDLHSKIHWQVKPKTTIIESFGFIYKGKVKYFHGQPQDLLKLKETVRSKIMFKDISDFYQPISMLGRGGSSKVYLVLKKGGTQEHFASKCVDKRYLQEDGGYNALFNEIQLMQRMKHEKIIHLEELYEGENTFYMVLEYLQGQSLHDMINRRQSPFDPDQAQQILSQILTGVRYLHTLGIMHRDLKPENIMFKQQNNIEQLKIVDFGLATTIHADIYPFPKCGTPGYVAPEIANLKDLNYKYDLICDVFSVGCIFFKLCTGKDLFPGVDYHEILKLNKKCSINLETLQLYRTPKEAIDLMTSMLKVNPKERITASQALDHPYFERKFESKKSKFQQFHNKTNPVFQTQNFKPQSNKYDDDAVEDENTSQLQVPVMTNIKTFGSFICKVKPKEQPNTAGRKGFKKFQTTDFDPFLTPTTPFSNNQQYRPSLVINHQQEIKEPQNLQKQVETQKSQGSNNNIVLMSKIEEEDQDDK